MNKRLLVQSLLSIIALIFLFGCAVKNPAKIPDMPSYSFNKLDPGIYDSKVDNFIMVFDAAGSMGQPYTETSKFDVAKALAHRLNLTIPELGQTAGLRSLGHDPGVSKQPTELLYGREKYSTLNLKDNLDLIVRPGGSCPLETALDAVEKDLELLPGSRNVVIIISDGKGGEDSLSMIAPLKEKYGPNISFYPIQVGDDPEGQTLLREISTIGGQGFYSTADDLMTDESIAAFVEKVFLTKKAVVHRVARVADRKASDGDGDGVPDGEDQCPGTPAGARVNAVGCWILDSLLFDFDKAEIKPQGYPLLDEIIVILEKNPGMRVELQGHTDNVGTEAYNMDLSMRRSNSVARYLVEKGILRSRLVTTGFGFKSPVALNKTSFGRSLNRRVELHPINKDN